MDLDILLLLDQENIKVHSSSLIVTSDFFVLFNFVFLGEPHIFKQVE